MFGKSYKKYRKPKQLYNLARIKEENELIEKYGLKNKREIWKADARIINIRKHAKSLITADAKEQKRFLEKLNKLGFKSEKIADVLALNKDDWLRRRLQTIIVKKKLANTSRHARQLIVHKHIAINGNIVNCPSYIVKRDEEDKIEIIKRMQTKLNKEENKDEK